MSLLNSSKFSKFAMNSTFLKSVASRSSVGYFSKIPSTHQMPSFARSYTSFASHLNKINNSSQSSQSFLITSRIRINEDQHHRNFNDFGSIPKTKPYNPLRGYAWIAGTTIAALYLYTCEPNFKQVEMRTEAIPAEISRTLLGQDEYVIASLWRRCLAAFVDTFLVLLTSNAICAYIPAGLETLGLTLAFITCVGYEVICLVYANGQTLGKYLANIKVLMDEDSTAPITLSTAMKFSVSKLVNGFFMIDALYALANISGDRKCIHNVISRTVVAQPVHAPTKTL